MKKPNILFFFTDDQRHSTIHALGCDEISTPNFDKLVDDSVAFTQAHIMGGTCGAVCMPSRAMVQTGRNLFSLYGVGTRNGAIIPKEHYTMPEYLRENGYYTHHIGKWHQDKAAFNRSYDNVTAAFGVAHSKGWYGTLGGHYNPYLVDFDPTGVYDEEKAYHLNENYEKIPVQYGTGKVHSTDVFCDAAVNFLNDYDGEKPFYLFCGTVAPHDPRQSPDEFEEMYSSETVSTPKNYMENHPFDNGSLYTRDEKLEGYPRRKKPIRNHIAEYYSMISHLDARFGDIVAKLKEKGLYDNTIIIFAGDNGLALGQHGLMGKQNIYEHSIRVPLIVKPVGNFKPKKTENFCYLFDIFPTVCEMVGLDVPASVNGTSFVDTLTTDEATGRDDMFGVYTNQQRSYKNHTYKLIEYYVNGVTTIQLFNLKEDPEELVNLATKDEYKELVASMHEKLVENQVKYNDPLVTLPEDVLSLTEVWQGRP